MAELFSFIYYNEQGLQQCIFYTIKVLGNLCQRQFFLQISNKKSDTFFKVPLFYLLL